MNQDTTTTDETQVHTSSDTTHAPAAAKPPPSLSPQPARILLGKLNTLTHDARGWDEATGRPVKLDQTQGTQESHSNTYTRFRQQPSGGLSIIETL